MNYSVGQIMSVPAYTLDPPNPKEHHEAQEDTCLDPAEWNEWGSLVHEFRYGTSTRSVSIYDICCSSRSYEEQEDEVLCPQNCLHYGKVCHTS